jgi:hypothetical protein
VFRGTLHDTVAVLHRTPPSRRVSATNVVLRDRRSTPQDGGWLTHSAGGAGKICFAQTLRERAYMCGTTLGRVRRAPGVSITTAIDEVGRATPRRAGRKRSSCHERNAAPNSDLQNAAIVARISYEHMDIWIGTNSDLQYVVTVARVSYLLNLWILKNTIRHTSRSAACRTARASEIRVAKIA